MTAPDHVGPEAPGARVTVFTKHALGTDPGGAHLTKRIALVDDQVVADGSPCRMTTGHAEVVNAATAADLARLISEMSGAKALALGCLKQHEKARVVTMSALATATAAAQPGDLPVVARSREHIDYGLGPAWMLVDVDRKGMAAGVAEAIAAAGGVWPALLTVVPGLGRAARVSRSSTSTGLRRADTGETFAGSGGEHHYLLVADGRDIERALAALHELCWLAGFGWFLVGKSGQLLDRSIVDRAVGYGERLVFEGAPDVVPPLVQDAAARLPIAHDGEAVDTRSAIPTLSDYEADRVAQAKHRARVALEPEASQRRAKADQALAEEVSRRTGMPVVSAMRAVAARHHGALLPDIELDFDDIGLVTVETLLAEPNRYVGQTLADPLEGPAYGRCKAMVLRSRSDPRAIVIHSFAHGGAFYQLRYDARTAQAALDAAEPAQVVDVLCAILPQAEIEADERSALIATAAAKAKNGVRAVERRLRDEQGKRIADERKRARDESRARQTLPTHPLPPPGAERGPIIRLVDDALAANTSDAPPMRDADGAIVAVRAREPWGLHLLTATSGNADLPAAGDEGDAGGELRHPPPPEPMIVPLSPVEVELQVEQHIRFEAEGSDTKPSYAAALQGGYIEALMQIGAASRMPVVRAINTAPLVSANGNVIAGVGLDRGTGLFHAIEPLLRDCLPAATPTEDEVREALRWLLDVWLVDVSADITSKLLALMLSLSMIERVLLDQRPAWIVTAGHRGGGKTTLINMITTAVFGRMAAAANWSDSEEERRKALFAYLRQGIAVLVWDNIARGTQIASACIEKSLTSAEVSDRVLSTSSFEAVPGGTVQIFTGNNIGVKGDMASRTFPIRIDVDRPDPENRAFAHHDPIGWTEQHRCTILQHLYAILIYGCRNRPDDQIPKTRFKNWWSLCAWPIEHVARLIGEAIDCTSLLNLGEGDDEETAVASTMLSVLMTEFQGEFTAKDVVDVIEAGRPSINAIVPAQDKERAGKLLDAFSELLGRPVDRLTALTIGKLLNNRLVDRPTFIDPWHIATLRKYAVEHTGRYYVDMTDAEEKRGKRYTSAAPPRAETRPPVARNSPPAPDAADGRGVAGGAGGGFGALTAGAHQNGRVLPEPPAATAGDDGDAGDDLGASAPRRHQNGDDLRDLPVFAKVIV